MHRGRLGVGLPMGALATELGGEYFTVTDTLPSFPAGELVTGDVQVE